MVYNTNIISSIGGVYMSNAKILIVDDEPKIRELIGQYIYQPRLQP